MRKSTILLVFLVSTLFVVQTEAGWFRRLGHGIGHFFHQVGHSLERVGQWVKRNGSKVIAAVQLGQSVMGKRSVHQTNSTCPEIQQAKFEAEAMLDKLQMDCPTFGLEKTPGITRDVINTLFTKSDEDLSQDLNDSELEYFENVLDVYYKCKEILAEQELTIKE